MSTEKDDKCSLDSSGSTFFCLEGNNIIMRMENKVKKEFVNNLKEIALNVSSERKKGIEDKIEEIKKDPSILDIAIPFEEVEMVGNFKHDKENSIISVMMKDSFAREKGFQYSFTSVMLPKNKVDDIESRMPKGLKRTSSIEEFAGLVKKSLVGRAALGKA